MKVSVLYNQHKPLIKNKLAPLLAQLQAEQIQYELGKVCADSQLIIAAGGDGTYLKAVTYVIKYNLPVLPVALGRLSFLAEITTANFADILPKLKKKDYQLEKRLMLDIYLKKKPKARSRKIGTVLNDLVIKKRGIARLYDTYIDSENKITKFSADGIILSTATGSTAYNLAAGGTILEPMYPYYLATPLCPHLKNWQSLEIGQQQTALISFDERAKKLSLTLDGNRYFKINYQSQILVQKSAYVFPIIRFGNYDFAKQLQKLC